ncbi:MAG: hypothetical protein EAZ97_11135 [Bacteroidetes bacterium]|nr:MAG: hypothetical protein EAZ97_11135 [Bacteroidota bacterium]
MTNFVQTLPLEYQIVLKYWLNVQILRALNPDSTSELIKNGNFDASKYQKEIGKGTNWDKVIGKWLGDETDEQIKEALKKLS